MVSDLEEVKTSDTLGGVGELNTFVGVFSSFQEISLLKVMEKKYSLFNVYFYFFPFQNTTLTISKFV